MKNMRTVMLQAPPSGAQNMQHMVGWVEHWGWGKNLSLVV